jgi:hypothetical protein
MTKVDEYEEVSVESTKEYQEMKERKLNILSKNSGICLLSPMMF